MVTIFELGEPNVVNNLSFSTFYIVVIRRSSKAYASTLAHHLLESTRVLKDKSIAFIDNKNAPANMLKL